MSNFITIGGYPVYLAERLAADGGNLPQDFVGLANSFCAQSGMEPGEGWFLMLRKDLDSIKGTSSSSGLDSFQKLVWKSDYDTLSVPKLLFHKAVCMSGSQNETDPNAIYLTRWVDKRHLLAMSGTKESHYQYNCRCPAPPATSGAKLYYDATLTSGSVWTWQTMLDDLWGLLPSGIRGSSPSLPYTPNGTPENFRFVGMSAWDAIGQILDKLLVQLLYDPQADSFSYTRLGTTQAGLTASLAKLTARLQLDYWPIEANQARFPEKIRVTFPTFIQNYGSDADVAQKSSTLSGTNLADLPAYTIDIATGMSGALAGTVLPLWDDMVAVYSGNASGDPQNSTALNNRATEVAGNWTNTVSASHTRGRKLYSGLATTILPGSFMDRVLWRDFGDGAMTEYFSFAGAMDNGASCGLAPYDTGRRILEDYPDKSQLVKVTSSTPDVSTGNTLYPGKVVRFPPEGNLVPVQDEICWIGFLAGINSPSTNSYWTGRLVGTFTSSGSARPTYAVTNDVSSNILLAKWAGATIWNPGTNSSNTVEVFAGAAPETDTFTTVTALNRFHTIMPGDFVLIAQNKDAWYVIDEFADVFFGQLQSTNINQGSTGSIHVFDDAFNDTGLTVTARALHDLVRNDYVQLFWERVNTSHNYEWYAIPLSRPCIGKPSSGISQGASGSVALYDSKGNSMTVSRTVWASFSKIHASQWCLVWWDYKQQQFFGAPLTYGVAQDIDLHLTSTLAHGDATAAVTVDSYNNGEQPTGTLTVNNTMGWSMANGGHMWATLLTYDAATGNAVYEIRAPKMTDWSGYSAADHQFLMHDTSGNTQWVTGAAC